MQQSSLRVALDATDTDLDATPPDPRVTLAPRPSSFLFALALVLSAATLWAMHGHVFRYPFLEDDYIFLTEVPRGLFGSIGHAIHAVGTYFRPVSREFYFWALHRVFGSEPLGFHLVNATLLLVTVALVGAIGRRIGGGRAGLFAAAIYTLFYPHRVLLGYISCSQDLIATAFACAALLAQLSNRRWLAGALLLAGAFSKESVVLVPVVLLTWEFAVANGVGVARLRNALRSTAPSWLAVAIWAGLTVWGRATFADAAVRNTAYATSALALTPAGLAVGARLTALTLVGLEQPWPLLASTLPAFRHPGVAGVFGLLGAAAIAIPGLLAPRVPPTTMRPARANLAVLGLVWLLVLAIPPMLLGTRFNAYYVALPAIGFAWCVGAWLARRPAAVTVTVCLVLGATNLLANATPAFRPDVHDRGPVTGISQTNAWRQAWEATYVRHFHSYLREHPPRRGTQLFIESPIGYLGMGTAGPLGPRLWLDDPTFEMYLVGSRWPGFGGRPFQFARLDMPAMTFTPLPESLLVAIRNGSVAYDEHRLGDARSNFARAVEIARPREYDWERGISFANLATVCGMLGDSTAARAAWVRAAALPSGRPAALAALERTAPALAESIRAADGAGPQESPRAGATQAGARSGR